MVLFGRYKCKALKPECEGCFMQPYCKTNKTFKA
jgi:endonuclease-3